MVSQRVSDILASGAFRRRPIVIQQKTDRPVQFEITEQTRRSLADWSMFDAVKRKAGYFRAE